MDIHIRGFLEIHVWMCFGSSDQSELKRKEENCALSASIDKKCTYVQMFCLMVTVCPKRNDNYGLSACIRKWPVFAFFFRIRSYYRSSEISQIFLEASNQLFGDVKNHFSKMAFNFMGGSKYKTIWSPSRKIRGGGVLTHPLSPLATCSLQWYITSTFFLLF